MYKRQVVNCGIIKIYPAIDIFKSGRLESLFCCFGSSPSSHGWLSNFLYIYGWSLDVYKRQVSVIADYFVIASGSNSNQIQAMVDNVEEEMFCNNRYIADINNSDIRCV